MKKFFICMFSFLSCSKIDENGFKTLTIKEGKHRSGYRYKTTRENIFNIECIFDNSAIYTTEDPVNQWDVNKLWGVSDCGNNHMDNSIRFGWRWLNDSLEILWFRHLNGNFEFDKITSVEINEVIYLDLEIKDDKYILRVNGVVVEVNRPCTKDFKRYKLYPYFGGDERSPHNIKIKLKGV